MLSLQTRRPECRCARNEPVQLPGGLEGGTGVEAVGVSVLVRMPVTVPKGTHEDWVPPSILVAYGGKVPVDAVGIPDGCPRMVDTRWLSPWLG